MQVVIDQLMRYSLYHLLSLSEIVIKSHWVWVKFGKQHLQCQQRLAAQGKRRSPTRITGRDSKLNSPARYRHVDSCTIGTMLSRMQYQLSASSYDPRRLRLLLDVQAVRPAHASGRVYTKTLPRIALETNMQAPYENVHSNDERIVDKIQSSGDLYDFLNAHDP